MPAAVASKLTTSFAPTACADSASPRTSSITPRWFGCWTTTAATSSESETSGSARPSDARGCVTTSNPRGCAKVRTTSRVLGATPSESTIRFLLVAAAAMLTASTTAEAPSYRDALETSRPVSSQITVWYSNRAWSTPWLTSGW
jgi:hypothetical protein